MTDALEQIIFKKADSVIPTTQLSRMRALFISVAAVAVAALLRSALNTSLAEAQFVTFLPAVVLAAVVGGARSGFAAVALAAIIWWAFFAGSAPSLNQTDIVALALFVLMSSVLVLPICALRVALSRARDLQLSLGSRVQERTRELELARNELQEFAANLEKVVERRTQELQRSRALLGSVIDGMPDAVFLFEGCGDELRFAYVNAAGATLLERPRDEILGKLDSDLISPTHAAENKHVLASNKPLQVNERYLEKGLKKRCVEVRKFPFLNAEENRSTLLTIIRDVTEFRDLEDSLRQKHRIDALGQLTGGIAHDFNNLLAIAIGNLDLLDVEGASPDEIKELVEDARNACLRGADLTSRLLAFARKQTLEPTTTDVNALIADYGKLLGRLLGADVDLRMNFGNSLWQATVDRAQLEAAITNLATNARDAMPRGGNLTISTRNETLETSYTDKHPGLAPGEYVAIEVSDTGCGMSPEVQEKAVEPFFTTKAQGHGTGLGLSMVFGFAKQSGGHVRIYSEPDQGTIVTLLLPRAGSVWVEEAIEETAAATEVGGALILVVDDNATLRRVTVKQLSSLGYAVLEAEDGPSALRLLSEHESVDLLLTDIVMPGGLNGADLGREARKMRPDLNLLYMSGFPEAAFGDHAGLDPDVVLLRKPFRKRELAKTIGEIVGKT